MTAVLASTSAGAANRKVDIVNKTGMSMTHFYASNSGTNSWEEDILGQNVLDNGETIEINIDDGTGACRFDFKAVFADGDSLVRRGINVCQIGTYTYNK
jgi:hypothetical protein